MTTNPYITSDLNLRLKIRDIVANNTTVDIWCDVHVGVSIKGPVLSKLQQVWDHVYEQLYLDLDFDLDFEKDL